MLITTYQYIYTYMGVVVGFYASKQRKVLSSDEMWKCLLIKFNNESITTTKGR